RQFIGIGRVIADAVRHGAGENMAVAILVLQALAVECRASGRSTEQEALSLAVAGGPRQVANALEAEHGVIDIERDHRDVVHRITGARRDPRRHGARLVDALLKNAALAILAVIHHLAGAMSAWI